MEDDDDDTIAPGTIAATLQRVLTSACPLSYFVRAREELRAGAGAGAGEGAVGEGGREG